MSKYITGDKELDRKLQRLPYVVQKKLTRRAVNAGLRVVAKKMKQSVPSEAKAARIGIGHSFKKARVAKKQYALTARVGVRVGKPAKKMQARHRIIEDKRKAAGKHGIGIGPMNLHWWITGSKNTRIRYPQLATKALNQSQLLVHNKIREIFDKGIQKEARKL